MTSHNTVIVFVILIGIAITLIALTNWDYMWQDEFLGKWASVITIISIVASPSGYFWIRYQNKREEQDRASRNLYGELKDALDGLDDQKYSDNAVTITFAKDDPIFFMNREFNHDIYDSLVNSGKINFLTYAVQQGIQDTFRRLKQHNRYISLFMDMTNDQKDPKKHRMQLQWMESTERKLLKDIPQLMKKLEKDFNL